MDATVFRILDANINRLREGLRVIEEYLRFSRDDPRGSWLIKRWRHQLPDLTQRLGVETLLAARGALGDVGKDQASPSRNAKADPADVALASFKRVQEALRAIEEYSASLDPGVGHLAAKMRFEIYEFEKELFLGDPRRRFDRVRLYLLIGSEFCPPDRMDDLAGRLLDAGVDCLQLREKKLSDRQIWTLAHRLADRCRAAGKLFIVNDRPDLARAVGADGVHVGQNDLPVPVVRQLLDSGRLVGISTHNPDQLRQALEEHPTYVAIGPAFDTATKPYEPTAGLKYIASAVRQLREAGVPEVAIGGITTENLPELLARGVRRVAVCGAILADENPVAKVIEFSKLLERG